MDDLYHERVVAVERVRLFSLLWSYPATVILFLETQRAVGDGKGACGLAILFQNQVVSRTRTRPTIHLARLSGLPTV